MKHIICYSGGHSSALVAIEAVRRFGKENVILLNHDINPKKENADIKRFKKEVADHLGIEITFQNINGLTGENIPNQFEVCREAGAITSPDNNALCTAKLKTEPFERYLRANNFNTLFGEQVTVYYGFDLKEKARIKRRIGILAGMGFKSDYPLALWKERTIFSTNEIGIVPPLTYSVWKHANCTGCLKGGILHWYVTFVHDRESFNEASQLEIDLDYSVNRVTTDKETSNLFLFELAYYFEQMYQDGIEATEHQSAQKFVTLLKKKYGLKVGEVPKPCACVI